MNLTLLLLPAIIMFGVSFFKNNKAKYLLAFTSFVILGPIIELFLLPKPYNILGKIYRHDVNQYLIHSK